MLESIAFMVGDRRGERITADPDDDKYLFAAREGLAEYVVSGDRHLLDLRTYEGVLIISPRTFLEILQPESG
jgi:predicted nucleic acid-binding protein